MAITPRNAYKTLLIIDDDAEDQEIFIEAVKEVDTEVKCETALSGDNAFAKLESGGIPVPDIIFLDMNMPKLNGKQVLREIKKRNALASIPVIMYSTSFAPRDIDEIRQLGAVHHLLKPSRFDDLCAALKRLLDIDWLKSQDRAS